MMTIMRVCDLRTLLSLVVRNADSERSDSPDRHPDCRRITGSLVLPDNEAPRNAPESVTGRHGCCCHGALPLPVL